MKIHDRIYGEIEIRDPLITDLISSKPLQRLADVYQGGTIIFLDPEKDVTRLEHSIGVWYLSKKFDATREEQVASLLHDVPHTTFSHVVDFLFDPGKHEFHDSQKEKIIMNSEIPNILKKHNVDIEKVLDEKRFRLLENDLPDISTDRLDYFLRDGFSAGYIPIETIKVFLGEIYIQKETQKLFFKNKRVASLFAILFMQMSRLFWLSPLSHGSFSLLAHALKAAFQKDIISYNDLWSTDFALWKKMEESDDEEVCGFLKRIHQDTRFEYADEKDAEFFSPNKPRFVDPWIEKDGMLVLLSDIQIDLKEYFSEFLEKYKMIGVRQIG